jgi:hypothetical protein
MRRTLLVTGLVVALSLLAINTVWAQGGNDTSPASGETIAILLAPLLAAATAIERIIEMLFNWYESVILNASELAGQGKGYLSWAQAQVNKWQNAIEWNRLSGDALRQAEDALADAQERLVAYLKSPFYTSRKRVMTLVMGVLFGISVAFVTRLQMFASLGVDIRWSWIDMFVTGLVIGTGSAPVHSLIGLLQNTKSAIDQARALWSGQAYNQGLEAELKRMGVDADLKKLKLMQRQMQDVLDALKERAAGEPALMGTGEAEPLVPAETIEQTRALADELKDVSGRVMGGAEMNRRVQRLLR